VTVGTITGHRTVSRTACPGDAGMALVTDVLPDAVSARSQPASTTTAAPAATTTSTTTGPPATTTAPSSSAPSTMVPAPSTTTETGVPLTAVVGDGGSDGGSTALPAGVAAIAALGAGAMALRARRAGR
jgi:hypothetical protein